jgi:hypothetical protein
MTTVPEELEAWKPIPSLPGYEASSLGRIRSWRLGHFKKKERRGTPLIRKAQPDRDGYLSINFKVNGEMVLRRVHHLVLEAFKSSRQPNLEGRHLDGKPSNNSVANLEWGTHLENEQDKLRHGTRTSGEKNGNAKFTNQEAQKIRSSTTKNTILAKKYRVSDATIHRIKSGKRYAS